MEWVKALADKLEASNKNFERENQRLHQNFKSQEEDRTMLVKQLVLVKKDNARLRQEIQELKEKVCLRVSSVFALSALISASTPADHYSNVLPSDTFTHLTCRLTRFTCNTVHTNELCRVLKSEQQRRHDERCVELSKTHRSLSTKTATCDIARLSSA